MQLEVLDATGLAAGDTITVDGDLRAYLITERHGCVLTVEPYGLWDQVRFYFWLLKEWLHDLSRGYFPG